MHQRVHIKEAQALNQMSTNLREYCTGVETALAAVVTKIQQTLKVLGDRIQYWERQYRAWKAEEEKRLSLLNQCQQRPTLDQQRRGCEPEFEQWKEAALKAATALSNVKHNQSLYRMVERADNDSGPARDRLRTMFNDDVQKARTTLSRKAARAQQVHAATLAGAVFSTAGTIFEAARSASALSSDDQIPGSPQGISAPASGDGEGREGPPNVEGKEGGARVRIKPEPNLDSPEAVIERFGPSPEGRY